VLTYAGIALAYFGELKIATGNKNFFTEVIDLSMRHYLRIIHRRQRTNYSTGWCNKILRLRHAGFNCSVFIHLHWQVFFKLENAAGYWQYGLSLALIATVINIFNFLGMKKIGQQCSYHFRYRARINRSFRPIFFIPMEIKNVGIQ